MESDVVQALHAEALAASVAASLAVLDRRLATSAAAPTTTPVTVKRRL